jgi:hypothetical protein
VIESTIAVCPPRTYDISRKALILALIALGL